MLRNVPAVYLLLLLDYPCKERLDFHTFFQDYNNTLFTFLNFKPFESSPVILGYRIALCGVVAPCQVFSHLSIHCH